MLPSAKQLVNLVSLINSEFPERRLIIVGSPLRHYDLVVDISDIAIENTLTSTAFHRFFKFEPSFELYYMDRELASYYGVEPGQYLALSFLTK